MILISETRGRNTVGVCLRVRVGACMLVVYDQSLSVHSVLEEMDMVEPSLDLSPEFPYSSLILALLSLIIGIFLLFKDKQQLNRSVPFCR